MVTKTMTIKGKRFVLVREDVYTQLAEACLPSYPSPDSEGNYPADQTMLVSIARNLIKRRLALGWSQAELARRAGIRVETLSRIEHARQSPSIRTIDKLDRALAGGKHKANGTRRG